MLRAFLSLYARITLPVLAQRLAPEWLLLVGLAIFLQPPAVCWSCIADALTALPPAPSATLIVALFAFWSLAQLRTARATLLGPGLATLWRAPLPWWGWAPPLAMTVLILALPLLLASGLWGSPFPLLQALLWAALLSPALLSARGKPLAPDVPPYGGLSPPPKAVPRARDADKAGSLPAPRGNTPNTPSAALTAFGQCVGGRGIVHQLFHCAGRASVHRGLIWAERARLAPLLYLVGAWPILYLSRAQPTWTPGLLLLTLPVWGLTAWRYDRLVRSIPGVMGGISLRPRSRFTALLTWDLRCLARSEPDLLLLPPMVALPNVGIVAVLYHRAEFDADTLAQWAVAHLALAATVVPYALRRLAEHSRNQWTPTALPVSDGLRVVGIATVGLIFLAPTLLGLLLVSGELRLLPLGLAVVGTAAAHATRFDPTYGHRMLVGGHLWIIAGLAGICLFPTLYNAPILMGVSLAALGLGARRLRDARGRRWP